MPKVQRRAPMASHGHLLLLLVVASLSTLGSAFQVMVNGLPGPMATAAAEACLRKGEYPSTAERDALEQLS